MSNKSKLQRGRPRGTGKDDSPLLRKIAVLMIDDDSLKMTTAIKRVLNNTELKPGEMPATVIRRLQHKWKEHGPAFLAKERQRRTNLAATAINPSVIGANGENSKRAAQFIKEQEQKSKMVNSPGVRSALREQMRRAHDPLEQMRRAREMLYGRTLARRLGAVERQAEAWRRLIGS